MACKNDWLEENKLPKMNSSYSSREGQECVKLLLFIIGAFRPNERKCVLSCEAQKPDRWVRMNYHTLPQALLTDPTAQSSSFFPLFFCKYL